MVLAGVVDVPEMRRRPLAASHPDLATVMVPGEFGSPWLAQQVRDIAGRERSVIKIRKIIVFT